MKSRLTPLARFLIIQVDRVGSIGELARDLGVSHRGLSKWLQGGRMGEATYERLVRLMPGLPRDSVFTREEYSRQGREHGKRYADRMHTPTAILRRAEAQRGRRINTRPGQRSQAMRERIARGDIDQESALAKARTPQAIN